MKYSTGRRHEMLTKTKMKVELKDKERKRMELNRPSAEPRRMSIDHACGRRGMNDFAGTGREPASPI